MKLKEITIIAITICTISLVGVGLANAQSDTTLMSPVPTSQSSSETRLRLRELLQEHAVLAGDVLIARYDTRPDFQTALAMLTQNSETLASVIEPIYGADVKREFSSLWQDHNELYLRYTDALKSGSQTEKEEAKTELDTFIARLSNLFASRVQGTNKEQLTSIFRDHVYFTRLIIENHAKRDYQNEYMNKHTGFEHAAAMGDILSGISWNY